jgi:prolyl oligopeptidase
MQFPHARSDASSGYIAHGLHFADPYAWMERVNDAETQAWISGQEQITRGLLRAVPGRQWMRETIEGAAQYERLSPPIWTNSSGREFLWHAAAGDEKIRLMMRRGHGSPLEPVLDPNAWPNAEALVFAVPSPDGRWIAFGKVGGEIQDSRIRVLAAETGELLADRPRGRFHASVAWQPDSGGFFYAACPEIGEVAAGEENDWNAIYEHRLGSRLPARRVFGDDKVKDYWCAVKVSECGRFAVLTKWDFVHANVVFLLDLERNVVRPLISEMRAINSVQVIGEALLIHTDLDAPRGRACIASLTTPKQWRELIAERSDTLQSVTGIGGRIYAVYSHGGSHRVQIHAEDGSYLRDLVLPGFGCVNRNEGEGVISGVSGSWHDDAVWVRFTSYLQPVSYYRYNFARDYLALYHVPDIGMDTSAYLIDQVNYESRDGTMVSMFLVHRKDIVRNGSLPVRLSGYGGFNISMEPRCSLLDIAWLKLGGVLAFANIRGGGEYGRAWHEAARKTFRHRAFDDFVAAARWLVSEGYTTASKIISRGNSNGGLMVVVAAMREPSAFGAVFSRVPLLDMLRFANLANRGSQVEYGSPDDPIEGPYLASYSPYHTIRSDIRYPVMAFVPAMNDTIAPPQDPLKMVARLQAEATEGGPYLLLPLWDCGHAGGTTMSALVEQDADELSFCCWALDVSVPERTSQRR